MKVLGDDMLYDCPVSLFDTWPDYVYVRGSSVDAVS